MVPLKTVFSERCCYFYEIKYNKIKSTLLYFFHVPCLCSLLACRFLAVINARVSEQQKENVGINMQLHIPVFSFRSYLTPNFVNGSLSLFIAGDSRVPLLTLGQCV